MRLVASFAAVASVASAFAAEPRIVALDRNVYHVQVVREGAPAPSSGLDRYGFLKRDWPRNESVDALPHAFEATADAQEARIVFPLAAGEHLYGLGDVGRASIDRRGGVYDLWITNLRSYIPIGFLFSSEGWGVFINSTRRIKVDAGKTDGDKLVITIPRGEVDFYFFAASDYRGLFDDYTRLTGRPTMMPAYAFGWLFCCNEETDQNSLVADALRFRDRDFPCDTLSLEPSWIDGRYNPTTRKYWNRAKFDFPNWSPAGDHTWVGALNRLGFKLSLWLCTDYDVTKFEEQCLVDPARRTSFGKRGVRAKSGFLDDPNLNEPEFTAANDKDARYMAMVAKTLPFRERKVPEGESPWFEHLKKFVDQGARAFKTDFWGIGFDHPKRKWANGMDDAEAHNLSPLIYARQMRQGYESYTDERSMAYQSPGFSCIQACAPTWAGDTGGGSDACLSVLNHALSGHSNHSFDLDPWRVDSQHFLFLCPWAKNNNWSRWYQPWLLEQNAQTAIRDYLHLRYRLFPYLYATGVEAHRTGWPMARPLPLAYPKFEAFANCTNAYMLGDALLVGAYTDRLQLPPGVWHEWRTDRAETGPKTVAVETTPTWGGALYVKAGAIIPTTPGLQHIDRGWHEKVVVEVWPDAEGRGVLYEDEGNTLAFERGEFCKTLFALEKKGGKTVFTVSPRKGAFAPPKPLVLSLRVHDAPGKVRTVDLGAVTRDERVDL